MSKKSLFGVLLVLVLILSSPLAAQRTDPREWWQDGCDPRAFSSIAETTTTYDFEAACSTYIECDPAGEGDFFCQMQAMQTLMSSAGCAPDDKACVSGALLYAGAILLYDMPFGESIDYVPSQAIQEGFPEAMRAFASGDYAAALAAMPTTEAFDPQFMLPFVRGVAEFMAGNNDAALEEFGLVEDLVPSLPLVHLASMLVYEDSGETELASFEAEWLRMYVAQRPESGGFLQQFVEQYPVSAQSAETWLAYGLTSNSVGPAGSYFADLSMEEPIPMNFVVAPEPQAALATNLSRILAGDGNAGAPNAVILNGTLEDGFIYTMGAGTEDFMMSASGALTLEPREVTASGNTAQGDTAPDDIEAYYGDENVAFFEGFSQRTFILVPEGAPDPRMELNGLRCGEGAISRLRNGMAVRTNSWADVPVYFPAPTEAGGNPATNPDGVSTGDASFLIIGEAQCLGDVVWWPVGVEYDSAVYALGFIAENDGLNYLYNPVMGPGTVLYCPAAPAPRLSAGGEGVVAPDLGANNLRTLPDAESELVTTIPAGAAFDVLDGPTCADGYVWWRINYDGTEGWTVEGDNEAYWLAPVLPEVATSAG